MHIATSVETFLNIFNGPIITINIFFRRVENILEGEGDEKHVRKSRLIIFL